MKILNLKDNPEISRVETFGGVDFGYNKPAVVFIQTRYYKDDRPSTFHVLAELSPKKVLIEELVREIQFMLDTDFNGVELLTLGSDKAGNSRNDVIDYTAFQILKKAFPQAVYTTSSALVSKLNQVMLFRKLLKQNRIFIDPSCKRLTTAFVKATPDANRAGKINSHGWLKSGGHDDFLDALALSLINHNPGLIIGKKKTSVLSPFEQEAREEAFFG